MNPEAPPFPDSIPDITTGAGYKCPVCGTLLYSQRSRMCGFCGAVLPREMVLTDEQAKAREDEREWARELAGKLAEGLAPTGRAARGEPPKPKLSGAEVTEAELASLEASLRQISCASEFKYRKRHTWFFVTGCLVTTVASDLLMSVFISHDFKYVWIPVGFNILTWYVLWRRAMPICPNCKQNIRICPARYCHLCGKPTNHQRCADCGMDESWTGRLPGGNATSGWIAYCPGCGVELDTSISRC